jgi:hypothetical protein
LSTSPNLQNDDRQHKNEAFFIGKEVIGTIKFDGENTNMYPDYIPEGFRLCGENI